jgi:hypothetical protein
LDRRDSAGGGLYGGITTALTVGSADVTIDGFGTNGRMLQAGHLEFVIFEAAGGALVYQSAAVRTAASASDMWYDSAAMTFTLRANTGYRLGVVADQDFTYRWDAVGAGVTGGGLTAVGGVNGNTGRSFAAPVNIGDGRVTNSLRVSGPGGPDGPATANPAPPGVVLARTGVPAFGLFLLRRRMAAPVG